MSNICEGNGICTQIIIVKPQPDTEGEALRLMKERAKFLATQSGFISVNLHRSKDGTHRVNYVQWTSPEKLAKAHHSPEFRKNWPYFGELIKEAEPCLYDVVTVQGPKSRHASRDMPEMLDCHTSLLLSPKRTIAENPASRFKFTGTDGDDRWMKKSKRKF